MQRIELRAHHFFDLFALLLDFPGGSTDADGRHFEHVDGRAQYVEALALGDDEKGQRQCSRVDAAGKQRLKARIGTGHRYESHFARLDAAAPQQMPDDHVVGRADGYRDHFSFEIGERVYIRLRGQRVEGRPR